MNQLAVPAVWMRGGTSKGLFFHARDLPEDPAAREHLLLRAIGSPDPYRKQIDGLGGATSSTSKVVVISPSSREDCDVDYWFGHVAIDKPVIDDSGNCGNLSAAVGPFAIDEGLVDTAEPETTVRIWQSNISKRILARVPITGNRAAASGEFALDGVPWPGAAIELTFEDAGGLPDGGVLPTGRPVDEIDAPDVGRIAITAVHAGNPAVFVRAADLGLTATETPDEIDQRPDTIERLEAIRCHAAVHMGLARTPEQARRERPATPKIHWVGPARSHRLHTGRELTADAFDLCARALSMGRAHHAFPGTSAIATAVAAAVPDSLVAQVTPANETLRIGHAAGILEVRAELGAGPAGRSAAKVTLWRSARRLMQGQVLIPPDD